MSMQEITLIVATEKNNYIGLDNELLWHLPDDLKFFKEKTKNQVVIMGRKTFESLSMRTLPSRTNVVISRQKEYQELHSKQIFVHKNASLIFFCNLEAAINHFSKEKELFIIGGGVLYKECLPIATKIYKTLVHTEIEGDTLFPELSSQEWQLIESTDHLQDDRHLYSFQFQTFKRIYP